MENLLISLAIRNSLFTDTIDNITSSNDIHYNIKDKNILSDIIHNFVEPFKYRMPYIYSLLVTYKYFYNYYNLNNAFYISNMYKIQNSLIIYKTNNDDNEYFLQGITNTYLISDMLERKTTNVSYLEVKRNTFSLFNNNLFNINEKIIIDNVVIGNKL